MTRRYYLVAAALFACFFTLTVIGLGAFTRLIDAGLGCPDWPLCYGHLTAPLNTSAENHILLQYPNVVIDRYKAWAEMIHRYFAGALGFIVLIILYLMFSKPLRNRSNTILGCCVLFFLAYQIVLGWWTVTYKLLPIVVTQHLLGGFLILTMLWLIYLNNRRMLPNVGSCKDRKIQWGALLGLILLLLQILLGAWTSTNYASLSCPDFPFCLNDKPFMPMHIKEAFTFFSSLQDVNYEGGVLPEQVRQTIQMMHRLGALVVILYFLIFTGYLVTRREINSYHIESIYLIWGFLVIQICIGIVNVMYKLPLITAVSHTLIAIVLLLSMVTFVYKLFAVGEVSRS